MVDFSIELLWAYLRDELTQEVTGEIELELARDATLRQTVASLRIEATGIQTVVDDDEDVDEEAGRESDLRAEALEAAVAASADGGSVVIESTRETTDDDSGLIDIRSMTQPIATGESADASGMDIVNVRSSVPPLMTPQPPKAFPWLAIAIAASVTVLTILGTILINWLHAPREAEIAMLDAKIEMLNARLSSREAEEGTGMSVETAIILQEIESLRARKETRNVTAVQVQEETVTSVEMDTRLSDPKKTAEVASRKHKRSRNADAARKQSPDADAAPKQSPDADAALEPDSAPRPEVQETTSDTGLDNLLGEEPPKTKSSSPEPAKPNNDSDDIPETLTKKQVRSGLEKVADAVEECAQGKTGVMKVKLVIKGANGRVESAEATGEFQDTASGACAERVVKMARFISFKKPFLKVTYPFDIGGLSTNPYGEEGTEPLTVSRMD